MARLFFPMRSLTPVRNATPPQPGVLLGLSPVKHIRLSDGDQGTVETIAQIRKLVHQGMTDQAINRAAIGIVRAAGIQQFDFAGETRALFEWVKNNIRFTRDIAGIETLRTAREILTIRAGDCDDIVLLLASLLSTVGHNVRLVTISSDPTAPRTFSHIYLEAEMQDGSWIALDSARRNAMFGRGPQRYFRKRIWSLTENDHRDVSGLAGYPSTQRSAVSTQPRTRTRIRRRRLGDDGGFDWGSFIPQIIGAGSSAAANIITALNTPQIRPTFTTNPATGLPVGVTPQGTLIANSQPGGVGLSAAGSIPTWMIYGGLGLLAFLVVRK